MDERCPLFKPWQKQAMFKAIQESQQRKQEFGWFIGKDGSFFNHCAGDACSIDLGQSSEAVGAFHTHPDGLVYPSRGDWFMNWLEKRKFTCIGGTHGHFEPNYGRLVRCYVSTKPLRGGDILAIRRDYSLECNYWQDGVETSKEVKRSG